jgi:hypothetical protein
VRITSAINILRISVGTGKVYKFVLRNSPFLSLNGKVITQKIMATLPANREPAVNLRLVKEIRFFATTNIALTINALKAINQNDIWVFFLKQKSSENW